VWLLPLLGSLPSDTCHEVVVRAPPRNARAGPLPELLKLDDDGSLGGKVRIRTAVTGHSLLSVPSSSPDSTPPSSSLRAMLLWCASMLAVNGRLPGG